MSICEPSKCTGCMACYNACTKNCITMEYDDYGILLPQINENICIGCNLCSLLCPLKNQVKRNEMKEAYACWSLDEKIRKSSSSGGIASIFYAHFIEQKQGTVYGCSYDENLQLKFARATTIEEIQKFKTSKYSMALIGNCFREIKRDLNAGLSSIFIGTPCQVAGLRSFLQKDYEKLLCIDLICHGVPSQKYLDEYIASLELEESPDNLTFRGENNFLFSLYKKKEIIYLKDSGKDLFFKAFLEGMIYRENCYSCQYANTNRVGDITIGDFWGLGKEVPFEHNTENGVSVVLINNEKGANFFKEIKDKIFFEKRSIEEAIKGNDQLRHPMERHVNREEFLKLYAEKGLKEALEKTLI